MCLRCMGPESGRLTVSTRLPSDAFDPPTWEILRYFALDPHALVLWVPPLALAVLLRVITARWKHQLLFPLCEFFVLVVLSHPRARVLQISWSYRSSFTSSSLPPSSISTRSDGTDGCSKRHGRLEVWIVGMPFILTTVSFIFESVVE
jgi:hypothetical protein